MDKNQKKTWKMFMCYGCKTMTVIKHLKLVLL